MNAGIMQVLGVIVNRTGGNYRPGGLKWIMRTAVVSTVTGIMQLLVLYVSGNYRIYLLMSFFIAIPEMVFAVFGRERIPVLIRRVLLGYLVAVLLGGFVGAVENLFHVQQIPVWLLILSVLAVKEGIFMFRRQMKKQESLCTVMFRHRGREICCTALWDTGNRLTEAGTNRPVHIICSQVYKGLGITAEDFVGLAGYCTLGKEDGVLPLYEIDGLTVVPDSIIKRLNLNEAEMGGSGLLERLQACGQMEGVPELEFTKAVVACAGERLLAQKPYQVILNVEGAGAG
jgi:prepilin signal peptidase PulO-like enzyme (type II secretory pathway)